MDHNCSLSGPLSYAVFIDINESRNPNSYKLLKRSSSFQFYQKRISNATNSSIHSINEVDKPSDLRKNGLADFDTFLVTARKTMPERFQSISNKHHSLRAHTSLQTTTNPSNSCSIPIKNFKKCCENNMGFNDYYEPIQISASVPNTSYNSPSRDDSLYLQLTNQRIVESSMSIACNMNDFGGSQFSRASNFSVQTNNFIPTPITRISRQNIQSQDSSGFYSYQTQNHSQNQTPISHSNSVKSSSSRQNHWQTGHCVIRHSSDSAFLDIYKNSHSIETKHLYSVNLHECTDLEYSVPLENLPPQIRAHRTNNRVKRSTSKRLHSFFKKISGFKKGKENDYGISLGAIINNPASDLNPQSESTSKSTFRSSVRISSKSSISKKSTFSRSSSSFRRKIRSEQSEPRSTSDSISSIDDNSNNIFFLRDTCNRIYYFSSENDLEMNAWCEQICECLGHKCAVTHSKGCAKAMRGAEHSEDKHEQKYSNRNDGYHGAYKCAGDKTSGYKSSEDGEDDEPVFDIEPEIEIEPENMLHPMDYSHFRVEDQHIKSSSINYRSMSHLRDLGFKNNENTQNQTPEFSKSLNYIRNPREFENTQVTSRSPELYNNFGEMSLTQRESNSTNSSRNTSSVRDSNPPTPPVPERSPFNSVVSSKTRNSRSSQLTSTQSKKRLTVPMPPIIPNRRPITATLSMDTGICKRRQTLDVRRIETAQRTRLANETLEREYSDLDNSGNPDPLIQLENVRNALRKTTRSSGTILSSETGIGSKIREKSLNLHGLELKTDFSGDADFLNNVGYSILDEVKSLPLRSGREDHEDSPKHRDN